MTPTGPDPGPPPPCGVLNVLCRLKWTMSYHVARPRDAHQGVEVRAVHVHQAARFVHEPGDLDDVGLEDAQRVGVRQHESGYGLIKVLAQRLQVHATRRIRRDLLRVEARHGGRRGVRAVRRIREEHAAARFPFTPGIVIRAHQQHARHLPLGSGRRLQRDLVHPGDFLQHLGQLVHEAQGPLRARLRGERVQSRETPEPARRLVDLGVVLHRARAQRIQGTVHVVVLERQLRVVPDHLVFGHFREPRRFGAQMSRRDQLVHGTGVHVGPRHASAAATGVRSLEYGGRRLALERKAGHCLPLLRQNS